MALVFTDTLLNILSKHNFSKIITCNDKDSPWITSKVKRLFDAILEFTGNELNVGETPLDMTMFEMQQINLYVMLNGASTKN